MLGGTQGLDYRAIDVWGSLFLFSGCVMVLEIQMCLGPGQSLYLTC